MIRLIRKILQALTQWFLALSCVHCDLRGRSRSRDAMGRFTGGAGHINWEVHISGADE